MRKPVVALDFKVWIADQIRAMAPYAKTIRPVFWYFAAGYDDVNVDFNRKIGGYSNHHFTESSLCEHYGAESCTFSTDFSITLEFKSWDDVVEDETGCLVPRKR